MLDFKNNSVEVLLLLLLCLWCVHVEEKTCTCSPSRYSTDGYFLSWSGLLCCINSCEVSDPLFVCLHLSPATSILIFSVF